MGGRPKSREQEQGYLKVSINHPTFKLDLRTTTPKESLGEIRRIVEALADPTQTPLEDNALYELRSRLSEEFFEHPDLISRLRNSLVLDEDVRVVKRIIPFEREYDFETGKETRQVNTMDVKGRISTMFDWLKQGAVRECLVHIRGELSREQQCIIMDTLKQRLGVSVQLRFFSTSKNLEGNVLLEAVCFGDNIAEGERW